MLYEIEMKGVFFHQVIPLDVIEIHKDMWGITQTFLLNANCVY